MHQWGGCGEKGGCVSGEKGGWVSGEGGEGG